MSNLQSIRSRVRAIFGRHPQAAAGTDADVAPTIAYVPPQTYPQPDVPPPPLPPLPEHLRQAGARSS